MMDAGVPLKAPVAGIAMGLVMDEKTGKYAVLTDIAGAEDHYGDMDFKVAGTATASPRCRWTSRSPASRRRSCARRSSRRARGRLHILDKMERDAVDARATNISTFAPRIVTIRIPVDKIRDVIGPGGKMIRSIIERTGVKIDVEDDGRVNVASADEASAQKAIGDHPGADRHAGAEQDLPGQGPAHHRFRRVRRDHARHRRPAARLRDRATTA